MDIERLRDIADRHGGLFTSAHARGCGFSVGQIRRRLQPDRRTWQRVWGPVLAEAGLRVTPSVRDRAVQLGVSGGVLAGPSAARAWGMPVDPNGTTWLAVEIRRRPVAGVTFLREPVPARDWTLHRGLRVTTSPRTVFDCARLLPESTAMDLLDRALQQGWITVDEFTTRLFAHTGRRGVNQVRHLVRMVASGGRFAAERECARLLTASGVHGWTANTPIKGSDGLIAYGDIVFRLARLVVELDGWAYHVTPERFQGDRQRQNRLVAAGWTVLRFTWRDLTERPEYAVATVRALLAAS
jgi:hypothetical protein